MLENINKYFGDVVEVISQQAGLPITFRWNKGISEIQFTQSAKEAGIIIRPLRYYEVSTQSH